MDRTTRATIERLTDKISRSASRLEILDALCGAVALTIGTDSDAYRQACAAWTLESEPAALELSPQLADTIGTACPVCGAVEGFACTEPISGRTRPDHLNRPRFI